MKNRTSGFTIIELVTVIILLGILATTALPKFTGSSSFEVYTYRTQLIAKLRLAQQRAMQQTSTQADGLCRQVVITTTRIGTPDRTNCTNETNFTDNWLDDAVSLVVEDNHSIIFNVINEGDLVTEAIVDPIINFDHMGRLLLKQSGNFVQINNALLINIASSDDNVVSNDDEIIQIIIETEGYIHVEP
jgi:prepilin-type N-terminal cleavage/methylation domain-containing protein